MVVWLESEGGDREVVAIDPILKAIFGSLKQPLNGYNAYLKRVLAVEWYGSTRINN
jgi:hypothetical protein